MFIPPPHGRQLTLISSPHPPAWLFHLLFTPPSLHPSCQSCFQLVSKAQRDCFKRPQKKNGKREVTSCGWCFVTQRCFLPSFVLLKKKKGRRGPLLASEKFLWFARQLGWWRVFHLISQMDICRDFEQRFLQTEPRGETQPGFCFFFSFSSHL